MLSLLLSCASSILATISEERGFLSFMRSHNLMFTGLEYHLRFGIYLTNIRYINEFNKKEKSFKLGINRFLTCTPAEYNALLTGKSDTFANRIKTPKSIGAAPESIDWREKNIVTHVKDQGNCGSCWAFSTIAAQECQHTLKKKETLILSEQYLVDCIATCSGCDGGNAVCSYDYIKEHYDNLFQLDSDYPYTAVPGSCKFDKSKGVAPITGYVWCEHEDESDMKEKVGTLGPASVGIDASGPDFRLYSTGVYYNPQCALWTSNHLVTVVGYGSEDGKDYWIVKNSWGESWGEKGYIKMSRNRNNNCGIATMALIPQVE